MIATLWLGEARRRQILRWSLAVLAILFIVPEVGSSGFNTPVRDPSFFTAGTYRRYLTSRDHVLTIPAWGPSQRWIAGAGFPFPLSTGSAGQGLPPSFLRYPIWKTMVLFPYPLPRNRPRSCGDSSPPSGSPRSFSTPSTPAPGSSCSRPSASDP